MEAIYILLSIEILVLIMAVVLLCGKGAGLIAGYNTSRKEDKSKYNEKKLCRVMGIFCTGLFFGLGLLCL